MLEIWRARASTFCCAGLPFTDAPLPEQHAARPFGFPITLMVSRTCDPTTEGLRTAKRRSGRTEVTRMNKTSMCPSLLIAVLAIACFGELGDAEAQTVNWKIPPDPDIAGQPYELHPLGHSHRGGHRPGLGEVREGHERHPQRGRNLVFRL